jgi:UDP-2-acetamido-3-amino-2,3-dideoxy-glucuronate N-acetyltransferase
MRNENLAKKQPSVAVVGCGYWGKNLVRSFFTLGALSAMCDPDERRTRDLAGNFPVATYNDLDDLLNNHDCQAVAIATPAVRHFELAAKALSAGKDVFVEKPLALSPREGQKLIELAREHKRILMVGHLLHYHPAILALKQLVDSGELGKMQYIYSSRLNLGKVRSEENILWSFAPHDISVILLLLGESPTSVAAHGSSYIRPGIVDTTVSIFDFASGVRAHIFVNWLHPFKEQKLVVVADRKMAVFDDTEPERKLVLYPHRIDWVERAPIARKAEGEVVQLSTEEPLLEECRHFVDSVAKRSQPRTDGEEGLRVLRVLEACEKSLKAAGQPQYIESRSLPYMVHPTAVVDEPCQIGAGTKIWHFSHIMAGSTIGRDCNLGQNVVVSPQCRLGNHVKVQNNVSIYTGVELEDDVFCGPSMVFTNVINPRSHIERKSEYRTTLVRQGASMGANSTILCGHTIGRYAFIAAGALVTSDVPDYALMMGTPARRVGWICYCGIRLNGNNSTATCKSCGRSYEIAFDECRELEPVALSA